MPHWKEEQLQQLLSETDEHRLIDLAASLAQELGMECISFSKYIPLKHANSQAETYNNYPRAWNEHYLRCNYLNIDPIVTHCHRSRLPILWDEATFRNTPGLWEEARKHGLRHGWSCATHDGGNKCMLSVVRSHTPVSSDEYNNTAGLTILLCNLMHTLMFPPPTPCIHLSARETEVLQWTAAGKTAEDISDILTLSKSTVNFHIRSIISKLNCCNKTSAVAAAAIHGLL